MTISTPNLFGFGMRLTGSVIYICTLMLVVHLVDLWAKIYPNPFCGPYIAFALKCNFAPHSEAGQNTHTCSLKDGGRERYNKTSMQTDSALSLLFSRHFLDFFFGLLPLLCVVQSSTVRVSPELEEEEEDTMLKFYGRHFALPFSPYARGPLFFLLASTELRWKAPSN